MKRFIQFFFFSCSLFLYVGCKKQSIYHSDNTTTLLIYNGAINVPSVMVNMYGSFNGGNNSSGAGLRFLSYGSAFLYYAEGKPTPIEIRNVSDNSLIYGNTYDLKKHGIYSLFVTGQAPNFEGVMIEEKNFPFVPVGKIPDDADSVINVRFVNLSPNVQPLNVRIQGSAINEATGLAYKGYTEFKAYSAKSNIIRYTFEFLENGIVIRTQSLTLSTTNRFRNVAVVLRGLKSGSGSAALSSGTVAYYQ